MESVRLQEHSTDLRRDLSWPRIPGVARLLTVCAVMFAGVPAATVQAAVLQLVQSNTVTSSATGITTVTLGIPVDTTKSFLVFQARTSAAVPGGATVRGRLTSTTVEFQRVTSETSTITIQWYVATFGSGVFVQRGETAQSALTVNVGDHIGRHHGPGVRAVLEDLDGCRYGVVDRRDRRRRPDHRDEPADPKQHSSMPRTSSRGRSSSSRTRPTSTSSAGLAVLGQLMAAATGSIDGHTPDGGQHQEDVGPGELADHGYRRRHRRQDVAGTAHQHHDDHHRSKHFGARDRRGFLAGDRIQGCVDGLDRKRDVCQRVCVKPRPCSGAPTSM